MKGQVTHPPTICVAKNLAVELGAKDDCAFSHITHREIELRLVRETVRDAYTLAVAQRRGRCKSKLAIFVGRILLGELRKS